MHPLMQPLLHQPPSLLQVLLSTPATYIIFTTHCVPSCYCLYRCVYLSAESPVYYIGCTAAINYYLFGRLAIS